MADIEDQRELGGSLIFIGLTLWVADLLIVFYLPALMKLGPHATVSGIVAVLAAAGLTLMITGYGLRRKSEAS